MPGPGEMALGSTPRERIALSHTFSDGVWKIRSMLTGTVSQADAASSVSSCPGPHPA